DKIYSSLSVYLSDEVDNFEIPTILRNIDKLIGVFSRYSKV
ncbi:19474_t:CDS:1, partial [Gigaspora rosea]